MSNWANYPRVINLGLIFSVCATVLRPVLIGEHIQEMSDIPGKKEDDSIKHSCFNDSLKFFFFSILQVSREREKTNMKSNSDPQTSYSQKVSSCNTKSFLFSSMICVFLNRKTTPNLHFFFDFRSFLALFIIWNISDFFRICCKHLEYEDIWVFPHQKSKIFSLEKIPLVIEKWQASMHIPKCRKKGFGRRFCPWNWKCRHKPNWWGAKENCHVLTKRSEWLQTFWESWRKKVINSLTKNAKSSFITFLADSRA